MRSKIFFLHILCFSLFLTVSCISRKPPETVTRTNEKTIREIVRDTVYQVEADSSFYQSYIECVNGKPVLLDNSQDTSKKQVSTSGRYLKAPIVKLTGNQLNVDCEAEARQLLKQWRETHVSEAQTVTKTEYTEKPFKWYHKAFMWFGGIHLLLWLLFIISRFYNPFKK